MKRTSLWIGIAAVVVALAAAGGASATALRSRSSAGTAKAVPAVRAAVRAPAAGLGVCRSLANDPAARQAMQDLRDEHFKDMQAWWKQYGSDPSSAAAQSALAKLRTEHWNDMRALLQKYGAGSTGTGGADAAPGYGPGSGYGNGMMGGGYGPGMMRTY